MPKMMEDDIGSRKKIVDAYDRLLEKHDFKNITVRMLCAEAEVSTGSFYHYFQSKDDLALYRQQQGNERYAVSIRTAIQGKTTEEQLYIFTQCYAQMNEDAGVRELRSVQFAGGRFYQQRHPVVNVLDDIIREGQRNGTIVDSVNYTEITDLFMETLRGCVFCWCADEGKYVLAEHLHKHVRILVHSLIKVL